MSNHMFANDNFPQFCFCNSSMLVFLSLSILQINSWKMKRELTRARKNERSVKKINEPIDLKTQSCATSNHNFIYHLHAFRFIQLHSAHSICILYLPRIYRYDILLPNIIASLRMQSIHRPTKICYKSTCDFFFSFRK